MSQENGTRRHPFSCATSECACCVRPGEPLRADNGGQGVRSGSRLYLVQQHYEDCEKFDVVTVFADAQQAIARFNAKVKEHEGLGLELTDMVKPEIDDDGTVFGKANFIGDDDNDIAFRVISVREGDPA